LSDTELPRRRAEVARYPPGSHAAYAIDDADGDEREAKRAVSPKDSDGACALLAPGATLRDLVAALPDDESPAILHSLPEGMRAVTYRELSQRIGGLTRGLVARGFTGGEPVAIVAPNGPEWIIAALAVANAGAIAVLVDPQLDSESLRHVLADSRPRLVFTTRDAAERLRRHAALPFRGVMLDATPGESGGWRELIAAEPVRLPMLKAEDPAVMFYTSGTTGPPKGVPLSHRNLLFELAQLREFDLIAPGERLLLPLPLHHVYAFVMGMLAALGYRAGIVLPSALTGPQIVRAIREGKVAVVIGVPRLYEAMLAAITARIDAQAWPVRRAVRGLLRLSVFARRRLSLRLGRLLLRPLRRGLGPRLRMLASGGAALEPDLAWTLEGLGWTVATGYGLTETAPLLTIVPPGDTRFDTAGRPIAGVELRIAPLAEAEEAAEAAPAVGEIECRGPNVFSGYHKLPERSAEAFTADGWFRTEDRGWLGEDGYLRVLGRASTFVVTAAGQNIQLEALEAAYGRHPVVKDIGIFMRDRALLAVAVPEVSEPRDLGGEAPEDAVRRGIRAVAGTLPRHQRLFDVAVSRDVLARTRLGKIRRKDLRDRYDAIKHAGEGAERAAGPVPIEMMSGEDQALLENAQAAKVWRRLAEMYPQARLSPDTHVVAELGIDSLEWITVTMEIGSHTGVELSEAATARIETVRDLLREVIEAAGRAAEPAPHLEEVPESYLTDAERRWLEPLGAAEAVAAWLLYHANRIAMRAAFGLTVSGPEHVPIDANVVIAPNHASVLDPFVVAAALPYRVMRRTCFAGWAGMAFANPLFRFVARLAQALPVEHRRAAFSTLALALVVLRGSRNLVWFPEGERSRDGTVKAFRPGIGVLLKKEPRPVVPALIRGSFEAMPRGRRVPRPRRICIAFGAPLAPDRLESRGTGERAEHRIADALRSEVLRLAETPPR
jgi:long-chain acyl-CoA synthetase